MTSRRDVDERTDRVVFASGERYIDFCATSSFRWVLSGEMGLYPGPGLNRARHQRSPGSRESDWRPLMDAGVTKPVSRSFNRNAIGSERRETPP